MKPFIFGDRAGIHIIDLSQTVPLLHKALVKIRDVVADGGKILFVCTKLGTQEYVQNAAERCAQYYVNARWPRGMLTNWETISNSIERLEEVETILSSNASDLSVKQRLWLTRECEKLGATLGGVREMGGPPDLVFVINARKEEAAVKEARKLGIPVVAVANTDCNPDDVDFLIPGNDNGARAVALYCSLVADAVIDGISESQFEAGLFVQELSYPASSLGSIRGGFRSTPAFSNLGTEAPPTIPSDSPIFELDTLNSEKYALSAKLPGKNEKIDIQLHKQLERNDVLVYRAALKNGRSVFEFSIFDNEISENSLASARASLDSESLPFILSLVSNYIDQRGKDQLHLDVMLPNRIVTYSNLRNSIEDGTLVSEIMDLGFQSDAYPNCVRFFLPNDLPHPFVLSAIKASADTERILNIYGPIGFVAFFIYAAEHVHQGTIETVETQEFEDYVESPALNMSPEDYA